MQIGCVAHGVSLKTLAAEAGAESRVMLAGGAGLQRRREFPRAVASFRYRVVPVMRGRTWN
ncbi:MAG: hypothetical protein CTY36_03455 [Methylocystis sp.]|nr:MAG: hypothetical protein CTY36_03455 [Methylocystis sp.]